MTDIVERLRTRAFRIAARDFNGDGAKLAKEAADEIEQLRDELREAEHARDGYMAERDMARERLEWSPDQPYDGIDARDETIARLTRNRDMWKGQCERQAEELGILRPLGYRMAEALRAMRHAITSETGFAVAVRQDSGFAYPWPNMDRADDMARAALDAWDAGR